MGGLPSVEEGGPALVEEDGLPQVEEGGLGVMLRVDWCWKVPVRVNWQLTERFR